MTAENSQTHVLDDLQAEQRQCWQAGQRVLVESFVSRHPELASRRQDVIELVVAEIRLRRATANSPSGPNTSAAFPTMPPGWKRSSSRRPRCRRPRED